MSIISLFDKSFVQSLTVDESVWLDRFFYPVVCPIFYVETLADLSKKPRGDRTADTEVRIIADKFPEMSGTPCGEHLSMAVLDILGPAANGRPHSPLGRPKRVWGQPRRRRLRRGARNGSVSTLAKPGILRSRAQGTLHRAEGHCPNVAGPSLVSADPDYATGGAASVCSICGRIFSIACGEICRASKPGASGSAMLSRSINST